jgi:adenine-specific DNA-methyltransferase
MTTHSQVTILPGDCREKLADVGSGTVQLVVTSPPYNAGKEYENSDTPDAYREFAASWVKHIPRLLTPSGSFWLNVGYMKLGKNQTLPLTYLYHGVVDLPLVQEIVWRYKGGMAYKKRFTHRTERWMWFAKNPDSVLFNLDDVREKKWAAFDKRNNPLGRNPTDCWLFNRVVGGNGKSREKTLHPCQFPEAMIERIVRACSVPGDIVVDPFSGSGTTAVVCKRLGRGCLAIETHPRYLRESRRRLGRTGFHEDWA